MSAETNAERRILVLGSSQHTTLVSAYDWDKLPRNLNVSDFDTVILNFAPFQNAQFAEKINIDLVPNWEQFARLIFSRGSEVIVIGSPCFTLGTEVAGVGTRTSDWWLPVQPNVVFQKGETTEDVHDEFAFYFEFVRRWSFYLHDIVLNGEIVNKYAQAADAKAGSIYINPVRPLATNRFQRPIGFVMTFVLQRPGGGAAIQTSGDVYWLPETTEITSSEAIDLILRERYELQFNTQSPDWLGNFTLPAQLPIVQQIEQKQNTVNELMRQLGAARRNLVETSRFQKLLYEQGEDVLEPIVRDALRELGATVDDPKTRGREDGRLSDPFGRMGMLEIKGRTGNLRLSDVRELHNWVSDGLAEEEFESKGLLIVNLQCDQDPLQRKEFIPPNCDKFARRVDTSIVTTGQLFLALVADQQGTLDRKEMWDHIFAERGLCDLPDLSQPKAASSPAP